MAMKVYRVAVLGCPRAIISSNGIYDGVGKSCLCNRFVRPEAYVETHSSVLSEDEWLNGQVTNGDHFIYWGAATKHLPDGSKARFQVVEQTEFYSMVDQQLIPHSSPLDYLTRASALHFKSCTGGKTAYKYKAAEVTARRVRGPVRNTQLFPNEDFGEKTLGIFGYVCVFDPTLEGKEMESQLSFWSLVLPLLAKRKRKIVVACAKSDIVDEAKIRFASNAANYGLKKQVPFLEVSARENVNVEEAFFALIGPPKKHIQKSPKNGKRPHSGYLTFKMVVESRKGDLNRAKDRFQALLQKQVTSFSNTWSEILPLIEREPVYRSLQELSGADSEETVYKMFQLRLIELKIKESSSKRFDKGSAQSYQNYLSSAFKGHPDLGNESLYDYVYSPRSSVSDISPTLDSLEALTEPSLPSSYRNTPDLSHQADPEMRPRSSTLQEPTNQIPELFTSSTLPRTPPRSKTHFLDVKSALYSPEEPPPLPPRSMEPKITRALHGLSQSQSFVETIPEIGIKVEPEKRRLSNSMDCLLDGEAAKEKRFNELVAEPYLHPVEVKEMMSQLPTSPLPPTSSPKPDQSRNSSVFLSMRVRSKTRPALPRQTTADNVKASPILQRSISFERGHKRSRSNPWVLEGLGSKPPELPPRNTEVPPPVPPRPTPLSTSSGSVFSENVMSPIESSLDITGRPPLPPTPRKVLASDKSPVSATRKVKHKSFAETIDVFEDPEKFESEVVDAPTSPSIVSSSLVSSSLVSTSLVSTSLALSPRIRELLEEEEDDDPDDPSNHYARIEDIQKQYVLMSSSPATLPCDKMASTETESVDLGKKSKTLTKASTGSREMSSSVSAPLLPWKRKWKKQRNGLIIHDAEPPKTSQRLEQSQRPEQSMSPSHGRFPRPLPPSPTKPRRSMGSNKGSGTNIYEAIDDLKLWRQGSRRHGQWVPSVEPRLVGKYVEAVRKLFAIPAVQEQWAETLKAVMPDEKLEEIPIPYANYTPEQEESSGGDGGGDAPVTEKPAEPEPDSDQSTPSPKPKLRHKSSVSADADDDLILIKQPNAVSPPIPHSPFVASPLSSSMSPFQSQLTTHSSRVSPFQSPNVNQFKKTRSRDSLIQILNQQLNTHDSLSSDSDSDEEHDSSSSEEEDSDLEDSIQSRTTQQQATARNMTPFVQTDLDKAIGLRASVSTDSDLVADLGTSDPPPRPPLSADVVPNDRVEVVHNVKPSQLIKKRGTPKRRYQNPEFGDVARNLSDSGISNCHSQTFEDGFSALPSQPLQDNSESEC